MIEEILKNKNIVTLVKRLVESYPKHYVQILTNKKYANLQLIERINAELPMLGDQYTLITKVYWLLNDLREFPLCENDGKPLVGINVARVKDGYGKITACCKQCLNKVRYARQAKANIEKYGYENPFQFAKEKIKAANLVKYGCEYHVQSDDFKTKAKKTSIEKYGTEHYQSTDEFKTRVKDTCMRKYGTGCALFAPAAMEKTRATSVEKYGCDDYRRSQKFKDKVRRGFIEKYGEKYGQAIWGGAGNAGQNRRAYRFMLDSQRIIPMFSEEQYLSMRKRGEKLFKFECKNCRKHFFSDWDNGKTSKMCPHCQFNGGISRIENEVFEFVSSIYSGKIQTNTRRVIAPLELDQYIEDKNLAIELDGLYWHNDDVKPDFKYHLNKTEMCAKAGIILIHIFDSEWLLHREIVQSRIKNMLGIYDNSVFARRCTVREMTAKTDVNGFLTENHIQGIAQSSVDIGMYDGERLVAVMTFGKCRFDKKHQWELVRFCSKLGYHIPGAAGKLLKYFEQNYRPKSLVTYADRRWSTGKLYRALGFDFSHNSNPNYWYFKKNSMVLESRVKYQKHKLAKILPVFDPSKTEVENMKANGYFRIFDCGNMVFEKTYPENVE